MRHGHSAGRGEGVGLRAAVPLAARAWRTRARVGLWARYALLKLNRRTAAFTARAERDATQAADRRVLLAQLVDETDEMAEQSSEQRAILLRDPAALDALGEGEDLGAVDLGHPG
jgi:hypothetical protein